MKTKLLALLIATFPIGSPAFVVSMTFEEKCIQAEAILHIKVEKVEQVDLTEGLAWQFHGLARCKVISSFKGDIDWKGKLIFIPCDYRFDESPSPIETENEYIVFLETMGNFSKFGHPIGPFCCHGVADGKVSTDIPGKGLIKIPEFAQLINGVLEKDFFKAANPQEGEQGAADPPASDSGPASKGKEEPRPMAEKFESEMFPDKAPERE